MKTQRYAVIMAGGRGTRFWPLSRARRPKQLLRLLGKKSLIREAVNRVLPLFGPQNILVVTVGDHFKEIRRELNILPRRNFLLEPQGNNTAPCIGLAAIELIRRDPDALMTVLPADHWIPDLGRFRRALHAAMELAEARDALITFGVHPNYPETGYGYILKGRRIDGSRGAVAYRVKAFKEKPSLKNAKKWIRSGSLWNSGIFIWKAATILAMMDRLSPPIFKGLKKIEQAAGRKGLGTPGRETRGILQREYRKLPSLSIDHAVLEKAGRTGKVLTIEARFAWSDVGNWTSLYQLLPHDGEGNAVIGHCLNVGSKACLVHSSDRLVVLLGMRNAMVVDTPDALLVGDIDCAQDMREVVRKLKLRGYARHLIE